MNKQTGFFFSVLVFVAFTFICVPSLMAQSSNKTLRIQVTGLRNDKGKVLITVFNSEKGFPESTADAIYKAQVKPKNGVADFAYENARDGNYAVAVLHDENDNLKMDTKAFGLPKEGYGFSKNVMGTFGPPSFKKASFVFPAQKEISIRIKY